MNRQSIPSHTAIWLASALLISTSASAQQPGTRLWEFQATGQVYASPAAGPGGVILVGSHDGKLYALDALSGAKRWQFDTGGAVDASASVGDDGTVFVGSRDHKLYAVAGASGAKVWEFAAASEIVSTPAVGADGTVYVGSLDSRLYAVDGQTGMKRWQFNTGQQIWGGVSIGSDGTVYVGSWSQKLYAVNATTGLQQWAFTTGNGVTTSAAVGSDGTVYIGSQDGRLYALDGQTGTKRWSFATASGISSCPAIGPDGKVYAGSGDSRIYALDGNTGAKCWEYRTGATINSSAAIAADGTVYVGSQDGKLYALDGQTGAKQWEFPTGGMVVSSPLISRRGIVYVGSLDKKVYAVQGTSPLAGSAWPMFQQNERHTGRAGSQPVILEQPASRIASLGANVQFTVAASGVPSLAYQWLFNGSAVAGGASATLLLTNVQPETAGAYSVIVSNSSGAVTSQVAVLTVVYDLEQPLMANDLVAAWPLDGNADDASTNRNQGLSLNAGPGADRGGAAGRALEFNGVSSQVQVPNSPSLNVQGRTNLTLALWVKPARVDKPIQALLWKWGFKTQYALYLADDRVHVALGDPANDLASEATLKAGDWRHVAAVFDAATQKLALYINGALDNERTLAVDIPATEEPVFLGIAPFAQTAFQGALDEVRIYARALSAVEIQLLHNGGIWIARQPAAQVVVLSRRVELFVAAQSARALSYQWFKDGAPVPGATSASYVIPEAQFNDGGSYTVVIGHELSTFSTAPAVLTVKAAEVSIALYAGVALDGAVGRTYRIEYATELNPDIWIPVFTNTLTTTPILWYDAEPAAQPKRFYRVELVP